MIHLPEARRPGEIAPPETKTADGTHAIGSSLRARLVLVATMALLPLALVIFVVGTLIYRDYTESFATNVQGAAVSLANEHRIFVSHIDNVLRLVRADPAFLGTPADCNALLARTRSIYGSITSINRMAEDGTLDCGSPPPPPGRRVQVLNADAFEKLFTEDRVRVIPTAEGAVTRRPVLIASRPAGIRNEAGRFTHGIAVGVDPGAVGAAIGARAERLAVNDFLVLDYEGRVLFYEPRQTQPSFTAAQFEALLKAVFNARETGGGTLALPDGTKRLFGIAPIPATDMPAYVVAIKSTPLQSGLGRMMAIAAAAIAFCLLAFVPGVTSWAGRRLFLNPIGRLHAVMMRFRSGDDHARVGTPYPSGELGELARAFDLLADRVQTRESELTSMVEQNRMLHEAIESSPSGIAIIDALTPDTPILYANPSFASISGYAPEDIIGRTSRLMEGPETDPQALAELALAIEERRSGRVELLNYRKDGSAFWNEAQLSPVFDAQGRLTRILVSIRDVSERRRLQAEIEAQSHRTSLVLESTSDGVYMLDHQWRFQYFNQHARAIFTHSQPFSTVESTNALIGQSIWTTWPSLFGTEIWENYHRAVNQRAAQHFDFYFSASRQWFAISAYPTSEGLSVFFHDVTEERAQEARLLDAIRQAEAANRAKSEFLAVMSHELRTPLNAVIGFSEMLTAGLGGPLTERQKEYLGHITTSGRHLVKLVSDILDVSRLEIDKLTLDEETVDLSAILHESLRLAGNRDLAVQIALSIEPNLPMLWGDAGRLKQVFVNLLTNAQKFTPAPGSIMLDAKRDEAGGITVTVKDTGIGMSREDTVRVLQPFQHAEGAYARRYGGAGLGLTIVNHLVKLHGGVLTLDSAPNVGTTATVTFPAERLRDRKPASEKQRA
jgi:PAS domain S-box-containing protein